MSFPPTLKRYLEDTYLFVSSSVLLDVAKCSPADAKAKTTSSTHVLLFESTIFYAQGGGQPSDKGMIFSNDGSQLLFSVNFVQLNNDGTIIHYGVFAENVEETLEIGSEVKLHIDEKARRLNSRSHSAGHALDAALIRSETGLKLIPTKGYHFQDGCYVEYILKAGESVTNEELDALSHRLTAIMKEIVDAKIPTTIVVTNRETAAEICRCDTTNYPEEVRVVFIAELPSPCGGTHVNSTEELGIVTVTKIKIKKGVVKINYTISDI